MCKKLTSLFLFLAGLIPAAGASAGLVAYWPFDEGAGTTAADATGSGNTGTLTGNPTWILGVSGGAIEFNGSAQYVAIENNAIVQLRSSTAYTVAAWVKVRGTVSGFILNHGEGCSAWSSWFLGVGGGEGDATRQPGNLVFGVRESNGATYTSVAAPFVPDTWVHMAAAFNGSTLRFYINGKEVSSVDTVQPYDNANRLYLGGDPGCGGRTWFKGSIDDLRIYDQALSVAEIQAALGNAGESSSPKPAPGATDVIRDVVLGWKPGKYASTHDVYFGRSHEDVNTASQSAPKGALVSQGQDANTFDPTGLLDFNQTYYWRVDEFNAPPTESTRFKGNVWSFTTEPYGYRITTPIKATASSFSNALTGPEKTIDGSGLDALDQHSNSSSQMWLSKKSQTPVWIKYEFDRVYSLYQMWVWNQNQLTELDNGYGAKDVTIETSTDGTTWTAMPGLFEFAQATAEPNYVLNTTVDLGGAVARYIRLNIASNWGGAKNTGLSEVRFFYTPVKAFEPTPAPGATEVAVDGVLHWRAGRTAASHEVYLGTDSNTLTQVGTVTDPRYSLSSAGAEYDRTYYWKVNEVNEARTPATWEGDVWSFSTPGYVVVDNFDAYDDYCNRIYYAWIDGYGHNESTDCGIPGMAGNGSGSAVGNQSVPYAEQSIVHGGSQSLPMAFDNPGATSYSEAIRTFAVPQDWTKGGIKNLVLYFRGAPDNATGQLYVKINNTKVVYNGKSDALTTTLWTQWNIDLASMGSALRSVGTMTIGVSGAGKGILYVDDIRLYRSAPAVPVPVDPGTTGLAAYYPFEDDAKDASGNGRDGTLNGINTFGDSLTGLGKALVFDGDDYVDLPIGTLISTLNSTTVATWVNFTNQGGVWQRIFAFGKDTTSYMFMTTGAGMNGVLQFGITATGNANESRVTAPSMLSTGWHHVAGVIDGSAKTLHLYLDGEVVDSGPTTAVPADLGTTTQNWLGRILQTGTPYYDSAFNGTLDEFRIYSRVLSAGEVRYLAGGR